MSVRFSFASHKERRSLISAVTVALCVTSIWESLLAEIPEALSQQLAQAAAFRKNGDSAAAIRVLRSAHVAATQANSNESLAWTSRELAAALMAAHPGSAPTLTETLALYATATQAFDKLADPSNAFLALLDAADTALRENSLTETTKLQTEIERRFTSATSQATLSACFPAYWQYQGQRKLAQGQFQAAAEAFSEGRKSLTLTPTLTSGQRNHLDAQLNGGRALALWRAGQPTEAKLAFTQSLTILEKIPTLTAVDKLEPRQNFALALLSWEQPQAAAQKLQQAIDEAITAQAPASLLIVPRLNLGLAQLASGHPSEACDTLEAAWKQAQDAQAKGRRLRAEIATNRWLALREISPSSSSTCAAAHTAAAESAAWMEALLAGSATDGRTAQRRWEDPLAAILTTELLAEPEGVNRAATAMINVQGAMFESECQQLHPDPGYQQKLTLAAMAHALPKHAAYLQITSHLAPAAAGHWEDTCSSLLLLPGQSPIIQPGPDHLHAWLESLTQTWNAALTSPTFTKPQEAELTEALQEAHELLWQPLLNLIHQTSKATPPEIIYLCIDGPLSVIPWSCLLDKHSQPILAGPSRLVFLSSPRALLRANPTAPSLANAPWLVVDASISKQSPAAQPAAANPSFPYTQLPLPILTGPDRETLAITATNHTAQRLHHDTATETACLQALTTRNPLVFHFAGHGAVNVKADGEEVPSRFWEGSATPHGLSQIGLFFPHFGLKSNDQSNDGWLSAAEISQLPLQQTQLAVFSSCQGGQGLAAAAEGRFDLARAAHLAGVRDVLVAAGPVWDQASVQFMQKFYQQIATGTDPTEAAWQAQRSLWQSAQKTSLSLALRQVGPYRLSRHR